jgi:hypothetical protein
MFLITPIASGIQFLGVMTWDFGLMLVNGFTPTLNPARITREGHPGAGGKWPEYIAPKDGDSRSCCPGLNTMANHGVIARDGKNISFKALSPIIHQTFNFAPSFCFFTCNTAANTLHKDYATGTFDLAEISLHSDKGGIEHDASLTRKDTFIEPDQSKPHVPFVEELLASATGKDKEGNPIFTLKDIAAYSSKRRVESRDSNPEFTLDFTHRTFGSANSATLLKIFGCRVDDLRSILIKEQFPDGWQSRILGRMGLTLSWFNLTVFPLEWSTNEKKYRAKVAAQRAAEPEASQ